MDRQGISALRALTGLRLGFSGCPSLLSAGLPGKLTQAQVSIASGQAHGADFQHVDQAVARTCCRFGASLELLS